MKNAYGQNVGKQDSENDLGPTHMLPEENDLKENLEVDEETNFTSEVWNGFQAPKHYVGR